MCAPHGVNGSFKHLFIFLQNNENIECKVLSNKADGAWEDFLWCIKGDAASWRPVHSWLPVT